MSQRMVQPNPDAPCQHCGATAHTPIRCFEGKPCPHCGGLHYGSLYCPYTLTQKEITMESQTAAEMPRYKCHKEVWALKIAHIEFDYEVASIEHRETDGSARITPTEQGYAPFKVDRDYVNKHLRYIPVARIVGGYYVVYNDGYKSFSPEKAFKEGYTRI